MRSPYAGRKPRNPFNNQVLGIRVRRAEQQTVAVKLTPYRVTLLRAIGDGQIKAGQASYAGQWRWAGSTVTHAVNPMIRCGWAQLAGKHLELTDEGRTSLAGVA